MLYARIFKEFDNRKVRYLVAGGVAVVLHGYIRTTGDLDLMISYAPENIEKFIHAVKSLGLKPKIPVSIEAFANPQARRMWIEEKNLKVFSLFDPKDPSVLVDIMVLAQIDFGKAYKRKNVFIAGGNRIPVISIHDLITLKKKADRPRDKIDIEELKKIEKFKKEKKN